MSDDTNLIADENLSDDGSELIQQLEEKAGVHCKSCGAALCSHQVLVSIALGFGNAPRCLKCPATAMNQSPEQLVRSMVAYFQRRACIWTAWKWASQKEGSEASTIPSCMT